MIKGKVGDVSKLLNKLNLAAPTLEKATRQALAKSALEIQKEAVKGIRQRSSGEKQRRYNPKRDVVVSKPGDPPNSDTGRLIQSVEFEIEENTAYVGSNLKYAAWLEFGTEHTEPRPWLAPALEKASTQVARFMQEAINSGIQKSLGIKGLVDKFNAISKAGSKSVSRRKR